MFSHGLLSYFVYVNMSHQIGDIVEPQLAVTPLIESLC